jgi:prefoldin subunit 5
MSAISEFGGRVVAQFTAIDAAIAGIRADVTFLKTKIEELQNSAGQITPADQAILDELEQRAAALSVKVAALDNETTPT